MIRAFCLLWVASVFGNPLIAQVHTPQVLVERLSFDWNHSGLPATFTLSFQHRTDGAGDADRLVIYRKGSKPWILLNNDDEWGPTVADDLPTRLRKNLVTSKRLFFVSAGSAPDARIYLILRGGGYGCCVGSLTVLTPGVEGTPKVVFHAVEHLFQDILPLSDHPGIALVGQPSDSEGRAANAESYDPYRVYILEGDQPARFDLTRSKAYTVRHYCQWAGPTYNEKFVAVNVDPGQWGAGHCHTMTEAQFNAPR